ncbi:MAG: TMEM14 family protein [Parachlamydiaceae bacterium]
MKQQAIVISSYALLNLIGGLIGLAVAGSLPSLIASALIAVILFFCAAFVLRGSMVAYQTATILSACLFLFFTYRYSLSWKIMPGGVMALISIILFIYLILQKKKFG